MSYLPPADRAFDVVQPVEIYRLIGRRPSQVYVDDRMSPTDAGRAQNRLSDSVYWRTIAKPGDQIQERPGSTLLVTADGHAHQILLTPPKALEPATAFVHAQGAAKADRACAEQLKIEGKLSDGLPRRVKSEPSRASTQLFAEDHPLIVDEPPASAMVPPEPVRYGSFGRSNNRRGGRR
jgi:hypothetical protein